MSQTSETEMTVVNIEQPLVDDIDSGFISSDTSDSVPALQPNCSSASDAEANGDTSEIQRQARYLGQHNRGLRIFARQQVNRLNERIERTDISDSVINRQKVLRNTAEDDTIVNRTRGSNMIEQNQRISAFTSTWTLRTTPHQEAHVPLWAPTPSLEPSHTRKVEEDKEE
ncbi:hypothetical protein SARC_07572 [Sphaeroforma arctica JP610]|uniref:Uncharacterized protein n=1 Tax=Sphaeroforma arctica JP610 TaxID=667725 RepID=A0A0L0FVX2_9EUKA|nr:hypothetical protein SARC_07572 [Sphaeroforma arctica JP610]KNC80063.1 hypothetical protein SARC_07572 [Sphaeroforma arctica JP610]|eukprot:XP_014153965.1 hypothetical protein SARC_07572 [Sphaeroforma arctica JP610]